MAPAKKVLVKISGEALASSEEKGGIDYQNTEILAKNLCDLVSAEHQVAVVVGGGNIFRGIQRGPQLGIARTSADQMGMLATLINGLALKEAIKKQGYKACLMTALECPDVAERFHIEKALVLLEKKHILILGGGTGHPFFTTDTCAALRASQLEADIVIKATMHVDGVYDKDPRKSTTAKKFSTISYSEVIDLRLGIVDLTAVTLCMTNRIPMRVFKFLSGPLTDAVSMDSKLGTLICGE